MICFATWPWEIFINAIGFCTCILIFIYLVMIQIKEKNNLHEANNDLKNRSFHDQILSQLSKQQSEMLLQPVSDAENNESRNLEQLLGQLEALKNTGPLMGNKPDKSSYPEMNDQESIDNKLQETDLYDNLYKEIVKAAGDGLDVDTISKKFKVPRGEIKLILKLKGHESYKKDK